MMLRIISALAVVLMLLPSAALPAPATPVQRVAVVMPRDVILDPTLQTDVLRGLQRAATEFPGLELAFFDVIAGGARPSAPRRVSYPLPFPYYEVEASDLKALLSWLAERYGVMMVIGPTRGPIVEEVAQAHPSVRFVTIEGRFIRRLPPTSTIRQQAYRDEQAAFVAGVAAAMKTRARTIGFIGATNGYPYTTYLVGYIAGARYVDPSTRIIADYVGMDADVARNQSKWTQVAGAQYRLGADVVFATGAPTLEGVLRAAEAAGGWGIGVGTRSSHYLVPGPLRRRLLTNIVKDYGWAAYDNLRMIAGDAFVGGHAWYTIGEAITVLVNDYNRSAIEPVVPRLRRVLEWIRRGAIVVPDDRASLEWFLRDPPPPP